MLQKAVRALIGACMILLFSCSQESAADKQFETTQNQLLTLLKDETLSDQTRYAVINRVANNLYGRKNYNGTIEFDSGCTLDSLVPGTDNPDDEPEEMAKLNAQQKQAIAKAPLQTRFRLEALQAAHSQA